MIPSPIILHIPHSSTVIPDDVVEQFVVSKQILQDQVNAITDLLTDELYGIGSYTKVAFPVSRLVVDPERFLDDSREPMSIKGLGVVYQKAPTNGIQLRRELSNKEKAALIKRYYRPHHAKLHKAVEQALRQYSRAIVVDCHSYNTEPLAWEGNHTLKRPEICLGVDDYHTPRRLAREVETLFTQRGYDVLRNQPYVGTLVPEQYYQKDPRVISIMIEIRKDQYMDEDSLRKNDKFASAQGVIKDVLTVLSGYKDSDRF